MAWFEPLESRVLMSRVFEPVLLADPAAGLANDAMPSAILDNGEVWSFTREFDWMNPWKPISDVLWRAGEPGKPHTKQTFGDHVFFGGGSISPTGSMALFGTFKVASGPGGMTGIGIFSSGKADPDVVLYGDAAKPTTALAKVGAWGYAFGREGADGSGDLLVTLRITDAYEIDAASITPGALRLVDGETTIAASGVTLDGVGNVEERLATFRFKVPKPGVNSLRTFSIERVEGVVRDKAGNVAGGGSLGMIQESVNAQGVWSGPVWQASEAPKPLSYPWSTGPWRGQFGLLGGLALNPQINMWGEVVLVGRTPVDQGLEPTLLWWAGGGYTAVAMADAASTGTVRAAGDEGQVLVEGKEGVLYWASGKGATLERVLDPAAEGLSGSSVRSATMSRDGLVVVFLADPAGTNPASGYGSGMYALARRDGAWTFGMLASPAGDGLVGDDETFSDPTGVFGMPGPLATDLNILRPDSGSRIGVHSTMDEDDRFRVVYEFSSNFQAPGLGAGIAAIDALVDGEGILPGFAQVVAQHGEDAQGNEGLMFGAQRGASGRMLIAGLWGVGLVGAAVNAKGDFGAFIGDGLTTHKTRVDDVGLRPVLVLPGIFGALPETGIFSGDLGEWMMHRGFDPLRLVMDPLQNVYDDVLATLEAAGYARFDRKGPLAQKDATLYAAAYDWRMPPVPVHEGSGGGDGAWHRTLDGIITGMTLHSLGANPEFHHGVDYLAWWMKLAKQNWEAAHPGHTLDSVDVYAHSTGGLVVRGYVQSDLYGLVPGLPRVSTFVSMAVPHRGASKAWNILHGNMAAEAAYKIFISKLAWGPYHKVRDDGATVTSPIPGDAINLARLDAAIVKHPELFAPHAIVGPASATQIELMRQEAFINLYIPTGRALLATYPIIVRPGSGPTRVQASADAAHTNMIALDLNMGTDQPGDISETDYWKRWMAGAKDPLAVLTARVHVAGFYSTNAETFTHVEERTGPRKGWKPVVVMTPLGSVTKYVEVELTEIVPMSYRLLRTLIPIVSESRAALANERWWTDLHGHGSSAGVGDGTVPLISAGGVFDGHPLARVHARTENHWIWGALNHSTINTDEATQRLVLREFGLPLRDVETGRYNWQLPTAFNGLWYLWDPVESYIEDDQGRRVGWTEAEGTLAEIPGAIVFGGADGLAFIPGDVGPVTLHVRGIEDRFGVAISVWSEGRETVGFQFGGDIAIGEARTYDTAALLDEQPRASAHVDPGRPLHAAAGEDSSIVVAGVGHDGRPVVFTRRGATGEWIASDPGGTFDVGGEVVTFVDPDDGLTYAVASASDGVWLLRGDPSGGWTPRNLTAEITGSETIARSLGIMVSPDGVAHVTGLSAAGELIRYFEKESGWGFDNLARAYLIPNGEAMPAFGGGLVSFTTSWGGLNVIGLDAAGTIWSVWWAPGQPRWHATNISTAYGAPALVGGLTVYLTPWDGINIAGIDGEGRLQATFWVPEFGAEWRHDNLTEGTGGPLLLPVSVTSYTSSWGGLNIAGLDRDTGEIAIYWWAPDRAGEGWAVEYFTELEPIPSRLVHLIGLGTPGLSSPEGSLNIFGALEDGRLIRLYWMPGTNWAWENLTDLVVVRG